MTLDPTVNAVVVGMSGFFVGAVLFVTGALDPSYVDGRPPRAPTPFRRGYLKSMRQYQEAQEAARALAPRSYSVALAAFYGLIFIVALGIVLSPVDMQWGWFLAGAFLGFCALQGVYTLAREDRLDVKMPRFMEKIAERSGEERRQAAGH